MLAFAGAEAADRVLDAGLPSRTPASITDAGLFRQLLEEIRRSGVAHDREEAEPGIACIAMPIRGSGRAVAAISITGPVERITHDRFGGELQRATSGVWRALFPSRRPGES